MILNISINKYLAAWRWKSGKHPLSEFDFVECYKTEIEKTSIIKLFKDLQNCFKLEENSFVYTQEIICA